MSGDGLFPGPCLNPGGDWFDKIIPDPEAWAAQFAATPVTAAEHVVPAGEPLGPDPFGVAPWPATRARAATQPWFPAQVRGTAPEPTPDGFLIPPGLAEDLMETMREHFAAVSAWYDANTPPLTRRQRIRSRIADWRERAACRAFKLIAGYDVPDGGDW